MVSNTPIANLSNELICRIIEFVPPGSHLDFALTCRQIATCSVQILERHQAAHKKYKDTSDINPTTIPTLLRSALGYGDPVLAWHVRSLELWRDRTKWEEWKTYDFETPIHEMAAEGQVHWEYRAGELAEYMDLLELMNEDQHDKGLEELRDGYDGLMKMLLVAHCPRIQSLRFINLRHEKGSCLRWMVRLIADILSKLSTDEHLDVWPVGFSSLRKVAVGIPSSTWFDQRERDYYRSTREFKALLRLPEIRSIYYKDLIFEEDGSDEDDDQDEDDEEENEFKMIDTEQYLTSESSSVEHIFLDNCDSSEGCSDSIKSIACAPRSLQTLALRSGDNLLDNSDYWGEWFSTHQGETLKSFMLYDYSRNDSIHGDRCIAYSVDEFTQNCADLKHLSIAVQDIDYVVDNGDGYVEGVPAMIPQTIECLVLWGSSYGDTTQIEPALVQMIESGNYQNLKAIHLEDMEQELEDKKSCLFQKLIAVGEKAGVNIYTLTNRPTKRHKIELPQAPDAFDLVSGPQWDKRPDEWEFDMMLGRMGPRGCGRCGACEQCFANYPEQLWRNRENELS